MTRTVFTQGGDLDCKLQEEKRLNQLIPELQVIKWMKQLLRAIDYMHRKYVFFNVNQHKINFMFIKQLRNAGKTFLVRSAEVPELVMGTLLSFC